MKIRTIIATAVTGTILMAAGSSLAFGADWTCPRGYGDCTSYEYCTTHDHGDCDGHWSEEGDWVCPDGNHSYRCSSSAASRCVVPSYSPARSRSACTRSERSSPGSASTIRCHPA